MEERDKLFRTIRYVIIGIVVVVFGFMLLGTLIGFLGPNP